MGDRGAANVKGKMAVPAGKSAKSLRLFPSCRVMGNMKTFLKILLAVAICMLAFKVMPLLLIPLAAGVAVTLVVGVTLAAALFVVLTVLAPVWVPVLAIVGLVSLCRRPKAA